jgi:NADP-dependent 3-hydroxy acid dehydrogenase YdfG
MGEAIVAALAALPDTHVVAVTRSTQWRAPAEGVTVEIGDPGDPAFLAAVAVRSGDVDGVINTIGVVDQRRPFDSWDVGDLTEMLRVNTSLSVGFTNAFLPSIRRRRGLVVFINSDAGLESYPNFGAYSASKFALRALADALRKEEMPNGVRVTSLYPGKTDTKLLVEDYRLNGWKYESEKYISLAALASVITMVVQLPLESSIYDVTIEPTNRAAPERLA